MSAGAYVAGAAVVSIVAALIATPAWCIRRTVLPDWTGAPARLAEAAAALGLFLFTAQLLGAVGLFRRGPLVLAVALVCALVWPFTRNPGGRVDGDRPQAPAPRPSRPLTAVAVAMVAVVVSQWTARVIGAFDRGIVEVDSRQYHLPFAAFFAQEGWTTRLHVAWLDPVWSFYPGNSELLHAAGILAFRHDLLSPLLNIGWLVLALLAGWCIGRPWGVGPASLAGVAVMTATPLMAAGEAGSAANDIAALALILTAIALAVTPGPDARLALAGTAAGLAVGTKVTAIVPIAAFAVVVILTHRRARATLLFLVPLFAAGSSWYLRNLVLTGNPLPPAGLGLPRPRFPALDAFGYSVMDYAGDAHFWRTTVPHGLHEVFGPAWPVILAAALAGAVLVQLRGPQPLVRLLGLVSILAAIAYTFTPGSAYGAANDPWLFPANLRYLVPALTIALVALPIVGPLRQRQTTVVAAYAAIFIITQWSPASAVRPWPSGHRPGSIVLGVILVAAAAWVLREPARRTMLVGAVAVGTLLLVGGYRIQRTYLAHRYTGTGAIDAWARHVHNARIGVTGYAPQYPLAGLDVSNRVEYVGRRVAHGGIATARTCAAWRQLINQSRYDFAVTGTNKWTLEPANETTWARGDPNAAELLSTPAGTVFALRGRLDPAACPASA